MPVQRQGKSNRSKMENNSADFNKALNRGDCENLLQIATKLEQQFAVAGERRRTLLNALAQMIDSTGGFWGWGRGRPGITAVTPVASIPFGFTETEWANIAKFCLSSEGQMMAQEPIFRRLQNANQSTVVRQDIVSDDNWYSSAVYESVLKPVGFDHFLTSVRYCSEDVWCCLSFFRKNTESPFMPRHVALIDLALAGIAWLPPQMSESIPPGAFSEITARQRLVMLFLLDGMPRKQIANNLGLTLHTVNDHVKALYQRFNVQSATELAAKFLKSV